MLDLTANIVFADGPSTHPYQPQKSMIRRYFRQFEDAIGAGLSNGGLVYDTKASMDADLAHDASASAWVMTGVDAGIYRKSGASGSGSWTKIASLPYSYIKASNVGAGSANAIQVTTDIPVPVADGTALIALPIAVDNTASPVMVSFDGGTPLTVKTSAGNDVVPGGLKAGMIVSGYVSGSTFRLLSDQASAAIQAAAEAAQASATQAKDDAEAARDIAEGFASDIVSQGNVPIYASVTTTSVVEIPVGITAIRTNGFSTPGDGAAALYKRVAVEPSHAGKFQSADGAWWELAEREPTPAMFGATGSGDEAVTLQKWCAFLSSGGTLVLDRDYSTGTKLIINGLDKVTIKGRGSISEAVLLDATLEFSNCNDVTVEGFRAAGTETRGTWDALSSVDRLLDKPLLHFSNCTNVKIRDFIGSGKRGGIKLSGCSQYHIDNPVFVGCLDDNGAQASNVNNAAGILCYDSDDGLIVGGQIQRCGEGILVMIDSQRVGIRGVSISNCHDNGVYVSSGFDCSAIGCRVSDIVNDAIKMRGSRHIMSGNTIRDASRGIASTGNGVALDSLNSNGYGTIIASNTISDVTGQSINVGGQDDGFQRDLTVSGNHIENNLGTVGNAAVILSVRGNLKFSGNTIRGSAANYAVLIAGSSTWQMLGAQVNDNLIETSAGQGIRAQYINNVQVNNNSFKGITSLQLIEFRNCAGIQANNNIAENTSKRISATSANSNTDIRLFANKCALEADAVKAMIFGNENAFSQNPATMTPLAVGQIIIYTGKAYIATGIASPSDWQQITP